MVKAEPVDVDASVLSSSNARTLSKAHLAALNALWDADPCVPSLESRNAWALANDAPSGHVHTWFSRRKTRAKKKGQPFHEGSYHITVDGWTPPDEAKAPKKRSNLRKAKKGVSQASASNELPAPGPSTEPHSDARQPKQDNVDGLFFPQDYRAHMTEPATWFVQPQHSPFASSATSFPASMPQSSFHDPVYTQPELVYPRQLGSFPPSFSHYTSASLFSPVDIAPSFIPDSHNHNLGSGIQNSVLFGWDPYRGFTPHSSLPRRAYAAENVLLRPESTHSFPIFPSSDDQASSSSSSDVPHFFPSSSPPPSHAQIPERDPAFSPTRPLIQDRNAYASRRQAWTPNSSLPPSSPLIPSSPLTISDFLPETADNDAPSTCLSNTSIDIPFIDDLDFAQQPPSAVSAPRPSNLCVSKCIDDAFVDFNIDSLNSDLSSIEQSLQPAPPPYLVSVPSAGNFEPLFALSTKINLDLGIGGGFFDPIFQPFVWEVGAKVEEADVPTDHNMHPNLVLESEITLLIKIEEEDTMYSTLLSAP